MSSTAKNQFLSEDLKHVVSLPVNDNLICIKCISPKRIRFEVEYSLGKGTTANSFLFTETHQSKSNAVLIHPP